GQGASHRAAQDGADPDCCARTQGAHPDRDVLPFCAGAAGGRRPDIGGGSTIRRAAAEDRDADAAAQLPGNRRGSRAAGGGAAGERPTRYASAASARNRRYGRYTSVTLTLRRTALIPIN